MGEPSIGQQLVDAVLADFPDHKPGTRAVHSNGIGVVGHFKASDVARDYCRAEHFQGDVIPATIRFSNGSGSPVVHDGWPDARGMAVRFHLPSGAATDLVAMTLREFVSPTVDEFLAFSRAGRPQPVAPQSGWRKMLDMLALKPPLPDPLPGQTESNVVGSLNFANDHRSAQLAVFDTSVSAAPVSYARATYNAIHTFVLTGPDGRHRHVRFLWQPVAGVKVTDPTQPPVDQYLQQEMRDRLAEWPAAFILLMAIGEAGDALDDPTIPFNLKRIRVVMGTLTLTAVAVDQAAGCEKLSFNPCRLVPGIDLSDDPILAARRDTYEVSRAMRGGTPCPFSNG